MAATIVIATSDQRKMVMVFEMKVLTLVAAAGSWCSASGGARLGSSAVATARTGPSLSYSGPLS